ncbi:MAG: acyl-CoA dehydratase activase [Actinomycetota bacterium]|jgi:predicted CoA-substrate-specific enzyme activase|nr:acyl-CoA dehydratase activase [Actinomycetota bacterium]
MGITAGIDVGTTYTKALLLNDENEIIARKLNKTGYKPGDVAEQTYDEVLKEAGLERGDIAYVVATGLGRFQATFSQLNVTDLTSASWGSHALFPGTRTILDVGGQSVKALRCDASKQVTSFRLNEKCAAGTGAFLEKTARYMNFDTEDIGALAVTSTVDVPISGVCTVFAEAEVINHLSQGVAAADIMQGSIISLVGKSVQLVKRVKMEPEVTLIGGIMRFPSMVTAVKEQLGVDANVAEGDMVQYISALGSAHLARFQFNKLRASADAGSVGVK